MLSTVNDQPADLLRLARAEGVGPVTFKRLLSRYGNALTAISALPGLARSGGRPDAPKVPTRAEAEREIDLLRRFGAAFLFLGQPAYPPLLAMLDDAPPVLAVLGDLAALAMTSVALVGGRNSSANGQRMAETLAADLCAGGLIVVSGMARGVDAAAHKGALRGRPDGPRTVAAVAGGLDVPYPPQNAELQALIADGGAVVTEAPLGTEALARHFPRRNRLIAGLSLGVVVVEAALKSGSLITARYAQENGRELFAVPGSPLDPRCHGSNDLIRQGAHLTETAADVIRNLPPDPRMEGIGRAPMFWRSGNTGVAEPENAFTWPEDLTDSVGVQAQVLDLLTADPTSVDDLADRCHLSIAAVQAALMELEVAGRVDMLPGNRAARL